MLNKEEIEKAKEKTKKWIYNMRTGRRVNIIHKGDKDFCNDLETLLQYIQELEESNKDLDHENNRLEKIEFERDIANKMLDEAETILANSDVGYYKKEDGGEILGMFRRYNKEDWKQYFEKKVEEK